MASLKNFLLLEEIDKSFSCGDIFKQLTEEISSLAFKEGLVICPYYDSNLQYFSPLSRSEQKAVVEDLRLLLRACFKTLQFGGRLRDSKQMTWNGIKELKFLPTTDFFLNVEQDDVVEILDPNRKLLFRNLGFFKSSSYSLEDLICRNSGEILLKDDSIAHQIEYHSSFIFRGEKDYCYCPGIPTYTLNEVDSPLRLNIKVKVHHMSPLYTQSGHVAGVATVQRLEAVEHPSKGNDKPKDDFFWRSRVN